VALSHILDVVVFLFMCQNHAKSHLDHLDLQISEVECYSMFLGVSLGFFLGFWYDLVIKIHQNPNLQPPKPTFRSLFSSGEIQRHLTATEFRYEIRQQCGMVETL
jgi:hypothetical protein